jgi:hypothetical protein
MNIQKREHRTDGVGFRCPRHKNMERSIRKNSFFERAQSPFPDLMQFTKCYFDNDTLIQCYLENDTLIQCAISSGLNYNRTTVDWASYIKEIMGDWLYLTYPDLVLGM